MTIIPEAVQNYLLRNGWVLDPAQSTHARATFEKPYCLGIDVPLRMDFGDYERRMKEALEAIAREESIPVSELLEELAPMKTFHVTDHKTGVTHVVRCKTVEEALRQVFDVSVEERCQ